MRNDPTAWRSRSPERERNTNRRPTRESRAGPGRRRTRRPPRNNPSVRPARAHSRRLRAPRTPAPRSPAPVAARRPAVGRRDRRRKDRWRRARQAQPARSGRFVSAPARYRAAPRALPIWNACDRAVETRNETVYSLRRLPGRERRKPPADRSVASSTSRSLRTSPAESITDDEVRIPGRPTPTDMARRRSRSRTKKVSGEPSAPATLVLPALQPPRHLAKRVSGEPSAPATGQRSLTPSSSHVCEAVTRMVGFPRPRYSYATSPSPRPLDVKTCAPTS